MNVLASECSGGCESGWTLYLEQSFLSPTNATNRFNVDTSKRREDGKELEEDDDDVEEDLSMVSDASSGPPHNFHEEEASYFNYENNGCFYPALLDNTIANNNNSGGKKIRQKKKEHRIHEGHRHHQELPSFLDDTASSPAFNFSKNNFALTSNQASMESVLDYSQGFSATHFESPFLQGRSAYQDHYGYMQPSLPGDHLQNNQWL